MGITVKDLFQYDPNFDPAKIRRLTGKSNYKKTDTVDYREKILPYHRETRKRQYTPHPLEVYLLYGIQSSELDTRIYYTSRNLLVRAVQQ